MSGQTSSSQSRIFTTPSSNRVAFESRVSPSIFGLSGLTSSRSSRIFTFPHVHPEQHTRAAYFGNYSARIGGLPVTNIRVPGDYSRIFSSESRTLARCTPAHSSRPSMHINAGCIDVIACSIFTISTSYGARPPMTFLCSLKAPDISSGILSIRLTISFSNGPKIFVADCASRAAKLK